MSAESIESITDDASVSPLVVALVAISATDQQDMRNVALYVSRRGGVKVSMHGHDWPVVARMIDRLRLPRRPQLGTCEAFRRKRIPKCILVRFESCGTYSTENIPGELLHGSSSGTTPT